MYLYQNNVSVSVVNPSSIKGYAQMQLKRIKTDKQDARLIADYCQSQQPDFWEPEPETRVKLKSLHRRIEQLNQILVMEKNRHYVSDEYAKSSIDRILDVVDAEIEQCRRESQVCIEQDKYLVSQQSLLQTIPGVGKATAVVLLSVLVDRHKFKTAKHLISYLGLSPIVRESGQYKGRRRVSKMGDRTIRKSLYMPARAACTNSKLWRPWFEQKLKEGKHPKQIYVLMMCKIL